MSSRADDASQEDLDKILEEIIDEDYASSLLLIPGVYEIVKKHYNNEILEIWEEQHSEESFIITLQISMSMGKESRDDVMHAIEHDMEMVLSHIDPVTKTAQMENVEVIDVAWDEKP